VFAIASIQWEFERNITTQIDPPAAAAIATAQAFADQAQQTADAAFANATDAKTRAEGATSAAGEVSDVITTGAGQQRNYLPRLWRLYPRCC
jgi:hypothetical protein